MDKLLDIRKKAEGRKTSFRIVSMYVLLACMLQIALKIGVSYLLFIMMMIVTAYLLYNMIQRNIEKVNQMETSQLIREEQKIRSTLESIQDGYYEIDMTGNFLFFNHSLVELLGKVEKELQGCQIADFMSAEDAKKLKQAYQWVAHTGTAVNCVEWEIIREDGTRKRVEGSIVLILDAEELAPIGFRGIIRDITDRKDSERMLEESRFRYKSLVDHNPDLVCSFELDGLVTAINPATEKITGYSANQLVGTSCTHLMSVIPRSTYLKPFLLAKKGISSGFEISITHKRGYPVDLQIRFVPIIVDSQVVGVFAIGKDITEHKQAEETINHMAYHDALTDLPNRRMFIDHLTKGLGQAERGSHKLAVLFLDLNRFKYINDSLGHAFGDTLLQTIAKRLLNCVGQHGTIARMGGDEFTILLPVLKQESFILFIVKEIIEAINRPILIEGHECSVTTSIGISIFPNDGPDAQTLMMNADAAMYRAKESHRNQFEFFTPIMSIQASERLTIEQELRKALERGELLLMYQPQLQFETDQITGVEALVRWMHPKRGLVSPADFIPLAEETGIIIPLGEWVLRTACRQNKAWQDAGFPPMRVAVNLSAYQFKQTNIVQIVADILKETGLHPAYLELEITESVAMQNAEQVIVTLEELKRLGIQVSIDDFGTGYSSLSYLRNFPIDRLKIDRSFVNDITSVQGESTIAASIIAMAQSLSLEVIAEGVETEVQFEFLKNKGCNEMQGYFFSKPLLAEDLTERLAGTRGA
ncbi:PAS domain S-box-containing protein/diguanylate cyclase (GGDEF) domain-containing protein [Paenibacillus sp. yr247]|uniref:sensor domain-containing protein n=1 Tax=Paenibacillus sp. yr247 TaxID=1761880 RepID=UPI00088B0C7C|nr:bifunctional diguanylate cyclase/phosphodiesterase [Paenibacillus sp. yr247]SDN42906.1 PAS domain S-box-containing protein/diguanylate cyclase (GGDEF) domain-containing protein [Paenibacillus sp. yr247]